MEGGQSEADRSIPLSHLGEVAQTQYQGDEIAISTADDGTALLRAGFQKLQGRVTATGLWMESTRRKDKDNAAPFRLRADAVGRQRGPFYGLSTSGRVLVGDGSVSWLRPGVVEEYRVSMDGIRQDFVIQQRPSGDGALTLTLAVDGADVVETGYGVRLRLNGSGRDIAYSRLHVTDQSGRELAARMKQLPNGRLAVEVDDTAAAYPVRIDPTYSDANWITISGMAGTEGGNNGAVINAAVTSPNGDLYIGGYFNQIGNLMVKNIARWDGTAWHTLGTGVNNSVHALAWTDGSLYAGGSFSNAGGLNVSYIARWSGTAWHSVGAGFNSTVLALAASDTYLYAGGNFSSLDDTSSVRYDSVARWDGVNWTPLGAGLTEGGSITRAYALAVSGNDLYAGGHFTKAGSVTVNHLARWDGSSWSDVGGGVTGGISGPMVHALTASGGNLYVGGIFLTAGTTTARNVACWNGSSWSALHIGLYGVVRSLVVIEGQLYAGGDFTRFGNFQGNGVARWNGTAWSSPGGVNGGVNLYVNAVLPSAEGLYVLGDFTEASGIAVNSIVEWMDRDDWDNLTGWRIVGGGTNGEVLALALTGEDLYVGGTFTHIGGVWANRVAKWDGDDWSALGGGMSNPSYKVNFTTVSALAVSGADVYAGGNFETAEGVTVNNVARWDGSAWNPLNGGASGIGVNGAVHSLLVSGSRLYVGGAFNAAGNMMTSGPGIQASYIAQWESGAWSQVGGGMNWHVNALLMSGNDLVVGGSFISTKDGSMTLNHIARWDGAQWNPFGSGLNDDVTSLLLSGSTLYAGGWFSEAGGVEAHHVASWNGTTWSGLGNGIDTAPASHVSSLAMVGPDLYAGGFFTSVSGQDIEHLARWDGNAWSAVGTGPNHVVHALLGSGVFLYVGGAFTTVGGKSCGRIATANLSAPEISVQQPADVAVPDGGSLDFGGVSAAGYSERVFVIRNLGTQELQLGTPTAVEVSGPQAGLFTLVSQPTGPVPAGGSSSFTLRLTPGSVGAKTALVSITSNDDDESPYEITVTGTGLSANAALSSLSLGSLPLSPVFNAPTITYTAAVPVDLSGAAIRATPAHAAAAMKVRINGGSYGDLAAGSPGSVLPLIGGPNLIEVLVTAEDGITTRTYSLTATRPIAPDITLSGNGRRISRGDALPDLMDHTHFGLLETGLGVVTRRFQIGNAGTADLNLSGSPVVVLGGAHAGEFSVTLLPATQITPGTSSALEISFTPAAPGQRSATVSLASNDPDGSPFTFAIAGNGRIEGRRTQTLVFTPPTKAYHPDSPLNLSGYATTNAGLPVSFTLLSGPATLNGGLLTYTGTGTVKVRASQPGDDLHLPAISVDRSIAVTAAPSLLTLTGLTQTYDGTPRAISVKGTAGPVDISYKIGAAYGPTAPVNAGSYPIKAVAGSITKTGTLVIAKAPLFVIPYDQRRLIGQPNPVLGFDYVGFVTGDNSTTAVSKPPTITTTAAVSSSGGLYPIKSAGGTSANYAFVYGKGTLRVETFAAAYEALLADPGSSRPAAKLEFTVAASSRAWTGKLTTPTETAAVSLKGTLTIDPNSETAGGTATIKKGTNTYLVTLDLPLAGQFSASAKLNNQTLGDTDEGQRLFVLPKGQTLIHSGTATLVLAPAQLPGSNVPAGSGWATATIDAKGLLKLTGKLADGSSLTASLASDARTDPGYRLFIQPYTPARTGSHLAGGFVLTPHPDLPGRRLVAASSATVLHWVKALRAADTSYRSGFAPVTTRLTLDPWLPPAAASKTAPAIPLAQRLRLSEPDSLISVRHGPLASAYAMHLPAAASLSASGQVVSVISPPNLARWKVKLTPATGAFSGSFELIDAGKKRLVPFTGVLRQPPVSAGDSEMIGAGHFILPALPGAVSNELLSGDIGFDLP